MRKIIFLLVAVMLVVSCGKSNQNTVEKPKEAVVPVKSNEKSVETTKDDHKKEIIVLKEQKIPNDVISINKQTDNLPELSKLLNTLHPIKPEIVDLATGVIWERGGKVEDVIDIDDSQFIITDRSRYKGKRYSIDLLDEIGATKTSHGTFKGLIGNINYDNYISYDNTRIACTYNNITEVYDSKTNELMFKYESREPDRRPNDFVCCNKLSGDDLFIGNPYEITCVDMKTKNEKYKISFETTGNDEHLKPECIGFVSFIGKFNDFMYVFTKGCTINLYKISSGGNIEILYSTDEVGERSYDDPMFLLGKDENYIVCTNNQSLVIVVDIKRNKVYDIDCTDKNNTYKKIGNFINKNDTYNGEFLYAGGTAFNLVTQKPVLEIPTDINYVWDVIQIDNFLLIKSNNVLYALDLKSLKTIWSFELADVFKFLPNYKSKQVSLLVGYKNILYFHPDNPAKMWKLDLKKVKVAQYRDDEKTSNHISTTLLEKRDIEKTWFDQNENKVYISDWTSFCIGDNSEINPLVFPTISDWCFDQGQSAVIQAVSMDIFVRWNGSEAVKASVKCNSTDKSKLKSEIMLEPGKLTRLKVWFDDKGQVLTIGDKSYNIYINPGWCGD